ncbi:MAG: pilus assembly protein TadG-related protein, partial [Gemmataceae bacterium]
MLAKPRKRRGVVAVLVAVALVAVLGIVALGLDGGLLLDNRIRVQAAADASALAAAADMFANWTANSGVDKTGTARTSALATASANSFTNDTVNSVVTVTFNPGVYQSGPRAGTTIPAGYVEVVIRFNQKRGFSSLFGASDLPVVARAVARGMRKASSVGVLLMNPSMNNALRISGTSAMRVDGTVSVNSSSTSAASGSGSAQLISKRTDIVGGYSGSGSYFQATDYPGGLPKTGVQPVPEFIQDVPWPDPSTVNDVGNAGTMTVRSKSAYKTKNNDKLSPGVYVGGISVTGGTAVTLNPGIYYMQGGGFTSTSNTAGTMVTANGVMIVNGPNSTG